LHFTPGNVEWEDVPNRVLDIPSGSTDVYWQGFFNGEGNMCLNKPGGLVATDDAEAWRQQHESVQRKIATLKETMAPKREARKLKQEQHETVVAQLQRELAQARAELDSLQPRPVPTLQLEAPRHVAEWEEPASAPPLTSTSRQLNSLHQGSKSQELISPAPVALPSMQLKVLHAASSHHLEVLHQATEQQEPGSSPPVSSPSQQLEDASGSQQLSPQLAQPSLQMTPQRGWRDELQHHQCRLQVGGTAQKRSQRKDYVQSGLANRRFSPEKGRLPSGGSVDVDVRDEVCRNKAIPRNVSPSTIRLQCSSVEDFHDHVSLRPSSSDKSLKSSPSTARSIELHGGMSSLPH